MIPVHGERDQSSSSSDSDSSDDEGQDIKILNNRMIGCMDKVFGLQCCRNIFFLLSCSGATAAAGETSFCRGASRDGRQKRRHCRTEEQVTPMLDRADQCPGTKESSRTGRISTLLPWESLPRPRRGLNFLSDFSF